MKIKQTLLAIALIIGFGTLFISPVVSAATDCGTSIIPCDAANGGINGLLSLAIKILAAGVGVAAVGGVIYGSVLYTTAAGSAEQTKQAKAIIFNVVIGLVAYALMLSFLNFIIPGGVKVF